MWGSRFVDSGKHSFHEKENGAGLPTPFQVTRSELNVLYQHQARKPGGKTVQTNTDSGGSRIKACVRHLPSGIVDSR